MNPIITVEGISKKYKIDHYRGKYVALRDRLQQMLTHPVTAFQEMRKETEMFWALKDISFTINQGDVVGIIGANGAGKSTLLKILSRITPPTEGRIELKGSVASLLEVGTGFHPELTGRENIFLNAAILGMSRKEMAKKFDQIVDFSGVEKFVDTPVKFYSSGMYVRLAFAIAAHLEPDILIVDEVLAVGDFEFQKKCLGKMEEMAGKGGRTIIFVSHNMGAIQQLCTKAVLLESGKIKAVGETNVVIQQYLTSESKPMVNLEEVTNRTGTGAATLTECFIEDASGMSTLHVKSGDAVSFVFGYKSKHPEDIREIDLGFSIHDANGMTLSVLYGSYMGVSFDQIKSKGFIKFMIPKLMFTKGKYSIRTRILANGLEADWLHADAAIFYVEHGSFYSSGIYGFDGYAPLLISGEWSIK